MRKFLWVVAFVALLGVTAVGIAAVVRPPATSELEQARAAEFTVIEKAQRTTLPTWSGSTLDDRAWDTAQLAGTVSVLNFWASWCGPCAEEWPELQTVADRNTAVRFVGINSNDTVANAKEFLQTFPSAYEQVFDARADLMNGLTALPNGTLPMTLVLDPAGRVAAWKTGPLTADQLERAITAIRA